jgi:hypothetical protein
VATLRVIHRTTALVAFLALLLVGVAPSVAAQGEEPGGCEG